MHADQLKGKYFQDTSTLPPTVEEIHMGVDGPENQAAEPLQTTVVEEQLLVSQGNSPGVVPTDTPPRRAIHSGTDVHQRGLIFTPGREVYCIGI